MKKNNKGFTLVELIVVLVILAILAAILVPALLGYIDKAREKSVTTNAEAAYVAAQALATEAYGKNGTKPGSDATAVANIKELTDITEGFTVTITYDAAATTDKTKKKDYIIKEFTYTQTSGNSPKKATWYRDGNTTKNVEAGGWFVEDAPASTSGGSGSGGSGSGGSGGGTGN